MAEYPEKLQEILDMFSMIEDRSERIDLLISIADRFKEVPEEIAKRPFPEKNRVPQCESEAFVFSEKLPDNTVQFHFAVENPQGISAMATSVILGDSLSGQPLESIRTVSNDIIYEIFGRELSTGKGLGLTGILALLQKQAAEQLAHSTMEQELSRP